MQDVRARELQVVPLTLGFLLVISKLWLWSRRRDFIRTFHLGLNRLAFPSFCHILNYKDVAVNASSFPV